MPLFAKASSNGEVESVHEEDDCPEGFVEVLSGWPLPARTSPYEIITIADGAVSWTYPADITALKLTKNAEINACRLAASRKSFTFAGKEIACDELSRSDIDGINGIVSLMQALPSGWVGGWKAMDNTYVPIPDVNAWKAFCGAMVTKGQALFAHAQNLKVLLLAATTAEQVAAINWEGQ